MLNEKNGIWDILARSSSGEPLTAQEKELLEQWQEADPKNKKSFELYSNLSFTEKITYNPLEKEEILSDLFSRINTRKKVQSRIMLYASVAASLIAIITFSVIFYQMGKRKAYTYPVVSYALDGSRSKVVLPDGSEVILNAGSKITYPTRFYGKYRLVELNGEAFFDVVKDENHPLIVKTESIQVIVLGTRFNLKSYSTDLFVETTLEKGLVKIIENKNMSNEITLKPGDQAIFSKTAGNFKVNIVNPGEASAWQYGKYYFRSKSFKEIAAILERGFNVSIDIQSKKLQEDIFSGDFVRGESLEQILRIVQQSTKMKYQITDQKVIITE